MQAAPTAQDPHVDPPPKVDDGLRPGLTTGERERLQALERENRELRRANEILKSAAAFLGAELDRRPTR
jgi:transposase